jgi:hypothetical protein
MSEQEDQSRFVRRLLAELCERFPNESGAVWAAMYAPEDETDLVALGAMGESVLNQKLEQLAPLFDLQEENRVRKRQGLEELSLPKSKRKTAFSVRKAAQYADSYAPTHWGNSSERRLRAKFANLSDDERRKCNRAFAEATSGGKADDQKLRQAVERLMDEIQRCARELS